MIRLEAWPLRLVIVSCLSGAWNLALAGEPVSFESTTPQAASGRAADYVVELPADDDDANPPPAAESGEPQSIDRQKSAAADGSTPTDDDDSEGPPAPGEPEVETIKERYANGATRIERQVTQDAQGNYLNHGLWKLWDAAGHLVAQGEYDAGERVGEWIRWYRAVNEVELFSKLPYQQFVGPFISQATFRDGELHGTWTIYDNQMRRISHWAFVDGKRHGASTWWYTSGQKMRECTFTNGEMDGYYMEWAADGAERVRETYQSGRKLAEKVTYYPGGQKKTQGTYLFARDTEQTPDDWWNCQLMVTNPTGRDEQHGRFLAWHPNGQQAMAGEYDHDVQVGLFTWWHTNAQKALEGRYDRGRQVGQWIWWHANGQKSVQGQYATGNPSGRWTWWQDDGKLAQSADLSHSEGVAIEVPRALGPSSTPTVGMPTLRPTVRR